jgi:hypothetical protein
MKLASEAVLSKKRIQFSPEKPQFAMVAVQKPVGSHRKRVTIAGMPTQ